MSNGKNWDPCCHHKKLGRDSQQLPTVVSSMASSGYIVLALLGAIFQQNVTAIIGQFPAGSIGGEKQGFGNKSGQA